MDLISALILGAVEGVTEFLPVSSTAHLILIGEWMGVASSGFVKSFEIAIQLGAILAVAALYGRNLLSRRRIWKKILAAFFPTAVLGFVFYKVIKKYLMVNDDLILLSLFGGGAFLVLFEWLHKEKASGETSIEEVSYPKAVAIGVFQSLAMVPGVSRAMATILGGQLIGIKRKTAVEFSFLLALPTMLAATALDLLKSAHEFSAGEFALLGAGFLASFVVALFTVKFLIAFVKNHSLLFFGFYRMAAALFFWLI